MVEDEGIVAADLGETLAELGYQVVGTVDTADAAIAGVAALAPDIVLMDVRLAGPRDGIAAAAELRRHRDVPVVFLTADSDDEMLARVIETGPLGSVVKPFRAPELRCAMELALHKHAMDQRQRRLEDEVRRLREELEDRTRQLEAANRELEAFSFSVTHDLRTPLFAIDGFSQLLMGRHVAGLSPKGVEHLQGIRDSTKRMGQLIDDLIRLGFVTRTEFRAADVDLSALAGDIIGGLAPPRTARITIEPHIIVRGDENLLRIALGNLLSNAWKFTGKVALPEIEFGRAPGDGAPVYFVRDNGAGFDMAQANRLFGAFQRLHARHDFEGNGIGLAIVQRIVHRHGGRIWAQSDQGRGATFSFTLGR